jgi:hypothetical protein
MFDIKPFELSIIEKLAAFSAEASKHKNLNTVFILGNTRVDSSFHYYWTPIRKGKNSLSMGIIVFSEAEGQLILEAIDGKFDYIFVDCEKKSILKTNDSIFNLERLSVEIIRKSKLKFFKGNDLTNNALDKLIYFSFKARNELLGGRKILVVGMGNMGFKISLRLVERGAMIYVINRSADKAKIAINTINLVKPIETLASVSFYEIKDINKDFVETLDAVLLCYFGNFDELQPLFSLITNNTLIIDVGKGCIPNNDLALLLKRKVPCLRLDIGDAITDFIDHEINSIEKIHFNPFEVVQLGEKSLISRGIIGLENDIVVDNAQLPTVFYGICDGNGGFKKALNTEEINFINLIISNNSN